MNNAKNLYTKSLYSLTIKSDRSRETGIIGKHFFTLHKNGQELNSRVVKQEKDKYYVAGPNPVTVSYYGALACVECFKSDYDPYVDFMFYAPKGVALVDKNLKVVYYSKNSIMFENRDKLLALITKYGPSVLIYMRPIDYLDQSFREQIKKAFKERLTALNTAGSDSSVISKERQEFKNIMQELEKQVQSSIQNLY